MTGTGTKEKNNVGSAACRDGNRADHWRGRRSGTKNSKRSGRGRRRRKRGNTHISHNNPQYSNKSREGNPNKYQHLRGHYWRREEELRAGGHMLRSEEGGTGKGRKVGEPYGAGNELRAKNLPATLKNRSGPGTKIHPGFQGNQRRREWMLGLFQRIARRQKGMKGKPEA